MIGRTTTFLLIFLLMFVYGCQRPAQNQEPLLNQFQKDPSWEHLSELVNARSENITEYHVAYVALDPLFKPLQRGETANPSLLKKEELLEVKESTSQMLSWLMHSPMGNIQNNAMIIAGELSWDIFRGDFLELMATGEVWQRRAVINTLKGSNNPWAIEVVSMGLNDASTEVKYIAEKALSERK